MQNWSGVKDIRIYFGTFLSYIIYTLSLCIIYTIISPKIRSKCKMFDCINDYSTWNANTGFIPQMFGGAEVNPYTKSVPFLAKSKKRMAKLAKSSNFWEPLSWRKLWNYFKKFYDQTHRKTMMPKMICNKKPQITGRQFTWN